MWALRSGRVFVNGAVAAAGTRVWPGDAVELDGRAVRWEQLAIVDHTAGGESRQFRYVKYWQPRGVVGEPVRVAFR